jgi:hypothetical protein
MKLKIAGKPVGKGVDQLLIRDATKYYLNILMKNDLGRMNSIEVEVTLIPNLSHDLHNDSICGYLDDRFRPNKFYVDLDSDLSYKGSLIGLAHELTHVKQMAFGERQVGWDGVTMRWFGVPIDPSQVHYYDLPWEIEAHGREYGLYDRFVQSQQNIELEPAKLLDVEKKLKIVA